MGSVAAPIPEDVPVLPANWREKALLSDAQCETLIYAINAFARDLPNVDTNRIGVVGSSVGGNLACVDRVVLASPFSRLGRRLVLPRNY